MKPFHKYVYLLTFKLNRQKKSKFNSFRIDMEGNPISSICGMMTAANGDQLFSQMTGSWVDETTGIAYYSYIVYDGNGRFEGATGETLMWGNVDYVNNTWYLEGEGTITY